MGDLEKRLRGLEARTPPPPRARPGHVSGAEIRALEEHIRRLERGWDEVGPVIKIVEPDEETAAVVRKIERLERLDQADGKDRNG
jgi:hypothetical protein